MFSYISILGRKLDLVFYPNQLKIRRQKTVFTGNFYFLLMIIYKFKTKYNYLNFQGEYVTMQFAQLYAQEHLPEHRYPKFRMNNVVGLMFLKRTHETQYMVHHRNALKWDNRAFNLMWADASLNLLFTFGYATKVTKISVDNTVEK